MRRLTTLSFALLALLLAVPAASAAPPEERWTPVVASVVATPEPVLAADGRVHLAYELLLINRSFLPPAKATVKSVQVLAGGKVLHSLTGKRLESVMVPFATGKPGVELARGGSGYVLMDVSFKRGEKLPRRLTHRVEIALDPLNPTASSRYAAGPTAVSKRPALVVAPPLRGDGWIVGNGCCEALTSHRAALLPVNGGLANGERFAIDFIQIQSNGMLATGPLAELTSYPFFGDEVLSATAGRVARVVNGYPETPPGALPPSTAAGAGGNYVTVAIGKGRYALYAHLQPGSIKVKVGDRVRVGDQIALLGSSGNSNAPHLHFQLMDGPTPVSSNGVPYRFSRFSVTGTLTNFGGLFDNQPAQITPKFRGLHRKQLPLNQQVIGFG
jgi:hypothetical protein